MPSTISMSQQVRLHAHLSALYPADAVPGILERLAERLKAFAESPAARTGATRRPALSEKTAVLITYGDQVSEQGKPPLRTLAEVAENTLLGLISDIHVLPFFPYSSDDGFSVIDYLQVDPALGTWDDIHRLTGRFGLMADLVINHVSAKSRWFRGFIDGEPEFADYFIRVPEDADLSAVVRPRALPLLTDVETESGPARVWTTFSADQVDLNYANPDVLLKMIDVLLSYVQHGATLIRLDAIAFLWKKIGTSCIHCEETHRVVKLMRALLDVVAPDVLLVTETNVPHEENVQYFGDGADEAQMVYQFPLPPLTVDAFLHGSAATLRDWAKSLILPPGGATFFNFLASHDGIGLRPLEGLLPIPRVDAMVEMTLRHGGHVSYKHDPDGRKSAYELNISLFDAFSDPHGREAEDLQVRKFLTAQAIMLSLAGVPGIYFHSLFGSRSWPAGVAARGENRAINREKLEKRHLLDELARPESLRSKVFAGVRRLLKARASTPALRPRAPQCVLDLDDRVFGILRDEGGEEPILCLHNVSSEPVGLSLRTAGVAFRPRRVLVGRAGADGDDPVSVDGGSVSLPAYGTVWMTGETD